MEDVVEAVLIHLDKSLTRHLDVAAVHDVGQYLLLNGMGVGIGLRAIEQLHLQLSQLVACLLVLKERSNRIVYIRDETPSCAIAATNGKDPAHKGTLAHTLVGALAVDLSQHTELLRTKCLQ